MPRLQERSGRRGSVRPPALAGLDKKTEREKPLEGSEARDLWNQTEGDIMKNCCPGKNYGHIVVVQRVPTLAGSRGGLASLLRGSLVGLLFFYDFSCAHEGAGLPLFVFHFRSLGSYPVIVGKADLLYV